MRGWKTAQIGRQLCKGGGGSGGSGKGGGGGGNGASSERNALGQEIAYGGEQKNVGNSRLFGIHEEVKDLEGYRNYDAATQAGLIESTIVQLKGRDDQGALTQRASEDLTTLWRNTSPDAKNLLADQNLGDLKAKNPAAQRIIRDAANRKAKQESQAQKTKQQQRPSQKQIDDSEDDLKSLFG